MNDEPTLPNPPDKATEAADALKEVKGILDQAGIANKIESLVYEYAPYMGLLTYLYSTITKLGISQHSAEQMILAIWYKIFGYTWEGETDGDGTVV